MKRKELVCVLRDYAKMTEEPPTGIAIEGQEEIMRRAADMIENSVEIDRVLEIINRYYLWHLTERDHYVTVGDEIRQAIKALKE